MSWAPRALRGALPDRNPLRRRADRLEFAVLAVLITFFLAGAPLIALAAGHWAYANAMRAARAQHASRHQVTAVLEQGGPQRDAAEAPYSAGLAQVRVPAIWTAPDGVVRTGEIVAGAGHARGSTVTVWTDRAGTLTSPPLAGWQVAEHAALAGAVAVTGFAGALIGAGVLARRALDRRRLAAWDSALDAT
jgi:hypothetical protein